MAAVEVGPSAREVAAESLCRLPADRHDPLLVPLADAADEAVVERDAAFVQRHRFGDAQAGAVEQLDERAVAEIAWLRPHRSFDQPLGLPR